MTLRLIIFISILFVDQIFSQGLMDDKPSTTRQDTLRGSITAEREWWDLTYYHLDLKVQPEKKFISGSNTVGYRVLKNNNIMQIDLQEPMKITSVIDNGKKLKFHREGNAYFIKLKKKQKVNDVNYLLINYQGYPKEAVNAPWDGGFSWTKDENGNHFVATSCQGLGASVWWPNKDHMYDEVDSMLISVNVPKNLSNISNGRLRRVKELDDGTKTFEWFVNNPINNYGVNINIGDYINFNEKYSGEKGVLDLDYYVLSYNLEKAKKQFKQVPMMIEAFEYWFGPYPFYEDSFKMVETPYLGMEHQSSITYGNGYTNGYRGTSYPSNSKWGLEFDYIIIHEGGHEWFANNITYVDIADMWIHEGFTCYSENLYVEYYFGKEAGAEYVISSRGGISNKKPIIDGQYGVNRESSGDIYAKGANILHTLRHIVNNDEHWRKTLRGLNEDFYHQTVTSKQVENYMSEKLNLDLEKFFNQYLRDSRIPVFEYKILEGKLYFRWDNVINGFNMQLPVVIDGIKIILKPSRKWNAITIKNPSINIDKNYYVFTEDTSSKKSFN